MGIFAYAAEVLNGRLIAVALRGQKESTFEMLVDTANLPSKKATLSCTHIPENVRACLKHPEQL